MSSFLIIIRAVKTNEGMRVEHFVQTEERFQACEIATEDIQRLTKDNWLIEKVNISEVGEDE